MKPMKPMKHKIYIFGYKGWLPQKWLRRLFAKSDIHRAWLTGYMGFFVESGKHCGVTDRTFYQYRK